MPLHLSVETPASFATVPQARADWGDRYLGLLCFVLAGYAIFGKGFAYVGVPPLFIGEITLVLGIIALMASRSWIAMLMTVPSFALLAFMGWILVRTVPGIPVYGFDALRDSVIALYGAFAFIIIALLLQKPARLGRLLGNYSRFALFYGLAGAALAYTTSSLSHLLAWPFSGLPVVYVRMGEAAVHLCGATVFVLLGLRRVPWPWLVAVLVGFLMIAVSRGAMLAFVLPVLLAAVIGGQVRRLMPIAAGGAAVLAIVLVFDLQVEIEGGRVIGPAQLINNVESIVGRSEASNLDGTKTWRLRWWQAIQDYTLRGPYFWTGKGFGVNLAEDDGYVVGAEGGGAPVRAPHNAHLGILARAGVPGLALWFLVLLSWFAMLARSRINALRNHDIKAANLFLWIGCYGLSMIINASFDVALEGPMLGIWFWCIIGLGIGASMLQDFTLQRSPAWRPS
ncbi:O-antigen ligase family protein [Bosea sp. WAO]|uniref:O-antigen ligase family protein n=1 Tax=Bosea sp. WAO TaxID=406341 RepID=UPI00082B6D8C|nr:O-antigen ligase family protein [Bosea sp. WAO]